MQRLLQTITRRDVVGGLAIFLLIGGILFLGTWIYQSVTYTASTQGTIVARQRLVGRRLLSSQRFTVSYSIDPRQQQPFTDHIKSILPFFPQINDVVELIYNPRDPTHVAFQRDQLAKFVFGLGSLLIGGYLLFYSFKQR